MHNLIIYIVNVDVYTYMLTITEYNPMCLKGANHQMKRGIFMKTKLLAIVLSLLMLVQPVMAIGMVGMESADETASYVEAQETADLSGDYSEYTDIIFREDFED